VAVIVEVRLLRQGAASRSPPALPMRLPRAPTCRLQLCSTLIRAAMTFHSQGQRTYGNRWTLIASLLPGRCNNDIKNYFNLYLKQQVRRVARGERHGQP
jgi:hypothetical protein